MADVGPDIGPDLGTDINPEDPSSGTGGLEIVLHPDLVVAFLNASCIFYVGETKALIFGITDNSGAVVAVPSDASIVILDGARTNVDTLTPDLVSSGPVAQQVFAADWTPEDPGFYYARPWATVGDAPEQIRGFQQLLIVRA